MASQEVSFFALFFKEDCVTTVHLYAVQTPFSGERLVIQEGSQGRGRVHKQEENVILSTGGMGVSRETRWCVLAGGNVESTGELSGKLRVWSEVETSELSVSPLK